MSFRASHITALSDDLLAHVFSSLDCTTLRSIAWTCKRWSAVLQEHLQLWHTVSLALQPKISRGRDRRNSYTTPCLLDTARLGAWLARRGHHIRQVQLGLGYPDALLLLPQLLLPLAPALQRLELLGAASRNWVHVEADWHWLRSMKQLVDLRLEDLLLDLEPLRLPPNLTALHIDRVGEGGEELSGWDELPRGLTRLKGLRQLTLGTAAAYVTHYDDPDDAEAVFAPLSSLTALEQLALPCSPLAAVPGVVSQLQSLTLLDFEGCNPDEHLGSGWSEAAFAHLLAVTNLRHLDLTYCGLSAVPQPVCALPALRTLLLGRNALLEALPAFKEGCGAAGEAPAPYLASLRHLDLHLNVLMPLPLQALQCSLRQLTYLDLAGSCSGASSEAWCQLVQALPAGCCCRHSCWHLANSRQLGASTGGISSSGAQQAVLEYDPVQEPSEPGGMLLLQLSEAAAAVGGAAVAPD